MADTPHDGVGTSLKLGSTNYTITNIVITYNDPTADQEKIDVSHLGLTTGSSILTQDRPLQGSTTDTGRSVQFNYLGKSIIADASTGTCTISTGGTSLLSGVPYTVNSSTLTLATNDAIRGQATIRIARV
ncbi:MAG: hypothetical protein EBR82_35700 [Caulobacteraceae bacterium]|nr:hypothetical protein [Caulobacteraceae bacterium]